MKVSTINHLVLGGQSMSEETRSKRQIIIDTINEGGATMESLAAAANCKYASVMSNFSMLRLMGLFPVKDVEVEVDGKTVLTYRFVDAAEKAELDAAKAEKSKSTSKPKDPKKRYDAAVKRVTRTEKAKDKAIERAEKADDDEELNLRAEKAEIEFKLANIELDKAKAVYPDWDAEVEASDEADEAGEADNGEFDD